jgi:hypothetical protein
VTPAGAAPAHPWVRTVLRPLALTVMAGCVALPLTRLIASVAPGLHQPLLFLACVLAVLEVNYSHYLLRTRLQFGTDLVRFRLIEIGFFFLVLKVAGLLLHGGPGGITFEGSGLRALQHMLASILDLETLLAMVLAIAFALAVEDTLNSFDQVGESPEANARDFSPLENLNGHYFTAGGVLLVLSGLEQVGLTEVFNLQRPPVTGLVGNVLLYFVLGLVLLSQVHYERLAVRWQVQGVRIPRELAGRWLRYTALLLAAAGLLAFALPTGYTAGALGYLGQAIVVIAVIAWGILSIIIALLALPFALLMALLVGAGRVAPPVLPPVPPPLQEVINQPLPPWVDVLRTIAVIALISAMVVYIVINYLRDRTGLAAALRRLRLFNFLRRLWAELRHRASGLADMVRASSVAAWLRERLQRVAPAGHGFFRLGAASAREQVMFYYLSLLRRARERGFGRRPPQTPHEYEPVLEQQLPEAADDVAALTAAFEESRYSGHPVDAAAASAARERWGRVKQALRQKKPGE